MGDILHVRTTAAKEVVDLTERVAEMIRRANVKEGLCCLFVVHTTAA